MSKCCAWHRGSCSIASTQETLASSSYPQICRRENILLANGDVVTRQRPAAAWAEHKLLHVQAGTCT